MKNNFFIKLFFSVSVVLVSSGFISCNFTAETNQNSGNQIKYGFLRVNNAEETNGSRYINVSSIDKADVTVSGKEMTAIKVENVTVENGAGGCTVENILVGKNRVVTVEAKRTIENVVNKIDGAVMRNVSDIEEGENSVNVNWASTALGNVFAKLLELEYDVSSLDPETVRSYLPEETHSSLIDTDSLAQDIASDSVKEASEYKISSGRVNYKTNIAVSDLYAQVSDPLSQRNTVSVSGASQTITNVAPGVWNFYILNGENTILHSERVTVTGGGTFAVNEGDVINVKVPSPRLENASGKEITVFIKGTTTVYLSCRTLDDETPLSGTAIYYTTDGTEPTSESSVYDSGAGIQVSPGTVLKAVGINSDSSILNSETIEWTFEKPSIGEMHPETGKYSPVDLNGNTSGFGWTSGTWALGANVDDGNTTFALYSANAEKILLEIYSEAYGEEALYDYWMEKDSDNVWRAKLSGDLSGNIYAFRCWGPNWTFSESWTRGGSSAGFVADYDDNGNRFNPNKVVFDPYAREMTHDASNALAIASYTTDNSDYELEAGDYQILSTGETAPEGGNAWREYDSGTISPKGYIIVDSTDFGTKPEILQKDAIIYEAHVRGLTKHSSTANLSSLLSDYVELENIPESYRGTYKGATYMIPYLKMLGINTIELLPVHETDNDANPDDGPGGNFWGYMTFDYFAPDRRYSSDKTAGGPTREFKEMIKAFHDNGMEVYLDVVYNHSGEGGTWHGTSGKTGYDEGKQCTVVSMRGIDNATYYSLVNGTKWSYWETTGCGNNLQCDNSVVRKFILDSLTYWIDQMGVDGFRFDLATTLGRVNDGSGNWNYSNSAQTLVDIASLGSNKNVEMIAESWDCGSDSYQVGNFPDGWAGWNGYYRDTMRGFVGNASCKANIAYSDALYGDMNHFSTKDPSINFICAHDGFTLADLCSYSGSGNYYNSRLEWPFGASDGGNGDNNAISTGTDTASRRQRARNYFALQMFSAGIPMIVYGDEFGRTQNGNNNPYNLDSVATWNNYNMIPTASPQAVSCGDETISQENGEYVNMFGTFGNTSSKNGNFDFARYVMNERLNNESLRQLTGAASSLTYYKNTYTENGYNGESDKCLGLGINLSHAVDGAAYYVMVNMVESEVTFTFPAPSSGYHWTRIVDTGDWAEVNCNYWSDTDTVCTYTSNGSYGVGAYRVVILKQVADGPVTPTCATPSISGTTPFETTTDVTISCGTAGASIYYTTDGTVPTSSSTLYAGAFTLSASATVKAIAIAEGYNNSAVASKFFQKGSVVVSNKSGVMLQGFTWDSAPRGNSSKWGTWYSTVTENAEAIGNKFAYLWCPPPSKCDTASSEGYCPTELNVLDNCYGTESELREMIEEISPTKAIADIVINHRSGSTSYGDFTNPSWDVVKGSNYKAICSNDEGFTDEPALMGSVSSDMRGASDTGEGYSASRDLDHTNTIVQNGIISWMNDKLRDAGFVGWRYDYVKGYSGSYVGLYDASTNAEFSVGEYWPTAEYSSSGWGTEIKNWVAATETGGYRSKAFDFALKGAMNSVFGNKGTGIANSNYNLLASSDNLYISQPSDAVTFIDNHDTGSTQAHWYLDPDDVGTAYALILTHPGYPCVAWQHYFTYAQSGSNGTDGGAQYQAGNTVSGTSNTLRQHIDKLIDLRNELGVEYDSNRTTVASASGYYVALVEGTNGNILVEIGSGWSKTSDYADYEEFYSGTNFKIWTEVSGSKCSRPVISFSDGICTITCSTVGSEIMYKIGSGSYTSYSSSFSVESGDVVYAYASADGLEDSAVVNLTYTITPTVTFYFKIPSWINQGVVLALNGNGHEWDITSMTACSTSQWYKCTVEVESLSTSITYQPRMTQNGTTKYMHAPGTAYNSSDAAIIPSTGYIVIDASGQTLYWSGDNFSLPESCITTPSVDPNY